jgi:hypothetical protein
MSGRLKILPKKSYCPWNPQNVERVLRDEREHAEAQERDKTKQTKESSRARLHALQGKKATEHQESEEHVNFFAPEEQQLLEKQRKGPTKNQGIMPLYLGQSVRNSKTAFYLQTRDQVQETSILAKDHRLKNSMDPMKEFLIPDKEDRKKQELSSTRQEEKDTSERKSRKRSRKHSSRSKYSSESSGSESSSDESSRSRRRQRKKSRKRRKEKRKSRSSNPNDSLDELRKRRAERERERQETLLRDSSRGVQGDRYLDQYNPRLSRK